MPRRIYYDLSGSLWEAYGLDEILDPDTAEDRNVRPDGYGVTAGDAFAVVRDHHAVDGRVYNILFATLWCDRWGPWTTGSTWATLYDTDSPDDMDDWAADLAEWAAMPKHLDGDPAVEDDHDAVCRLSESDCDRLGLAIVDGNDEGLAFKGTHEAVWAFVASLGADVLPPVDGGWLPVETADGTDLGQIDPAPSGAAWIFSALNAPMRRIYESRPY